jgi:integrase
MGRINRGTIYERKVTPKKTLYFARVRWTDENGKPCDKRFPPMENETKAQALIDKFKKDLEKGGSDYVGAEKMTFADLAKEYKESKLVPAVMRRGRKVSGLKGLQSAQCHLKALIDHFGRRKIRTITHGSIEKFKVERLNCPTIHGTERQISTVNRELELLRAILRFARQNNWLTESPFEKGEPLIDKDGEHKRERTLSPDEEMRLLAACTGRRAHLRALVIAALDTTCRRGELFKLKWCDVNFASRTINILVQNTKTEKRRVVPISLRLHEELTRLWEESPKDLNGSVFGYDKPNSTCKTAFAAALKQAGIKDFRFHDIRHTATTRLVHAKVPDRVVKKISGHQQDKTFDRYVNLSTEMIVDAADALDTLNAAAHNQATITATEMVN